MVSVGTAEMRCNVFLPCKRAAAFDFCDWNFSLSFFFFGLLVWLCYQLHGSFLFRVGFPLSLSIFPPSPKNSVFPFMLRLKGSGTFWLLNITKTKLYLNVKQKPKRAQSCPLSPDSRLWSGWFYLSWRNLSQEIAFPFSVINCEKTYQASPQTV